METGICLNRYFQQGFNEKCWPSDNTLVITTERYEFVNQVLMSIDYNTTVDYTRGPKENENHFSIIRSFR